MINFHVLKCFRGLIALLILSLFSSFLGAEQDSVSLELIQVCHFELAYRDKGSGGDQNVAIYRPTVPFGYYIIGDYAQGDYQKISACTLAVKPASSESAGLLIAPGHWELVWTDKGSGAHMDGSVWHPVSPDKNYVCIGSVGQTGYNKPSLQNYRCVHQCLVENVPVANYFGLISVPGKGIRSACID